MKSISIPFTLNLTISINVNTIKKKKEEAYTVFKYQRTVFVDQIIRQKITKMPGGQFEKAGLELDCNLGNKPCL